MTHIHRPKAWTLTFIAVAFFSGCSSSQNSAGEVAGTTTTASGSTSTSSATSTTSRTGSSTTSTSTAPEVLVLRKGGLGSLELGAGEASVFKALAGQLGQPNADEITKYPHRVEGGRYQNDDRDYQYVAPIGRTVCWDEESGASLCVYFAGTKEGALTFTGWSYAGSEEGELGSESGATIGTMWSEIPAIKVDDGGCYSIGSGHIDGIRLTLESSGKGFSFFDDDGDYKTQVPDRRDVRIVRMDAGEAPIFVLGDC